MKLSDPSVGLTSKIVMHVDYTSNNDGWYSPKIVYKALFNDRCLEVYNCPYYMSCLIGHLDGTCPKGTKGREGSEEVILNMVEEHDLIEVMSRDKS